jgi:hypothetical protein
MSSELKTNKVSPATGTALQIGDSGDTITIPSGATIANSGTATGFASDNTPSFRAYLSTNQTGTTNSAWNKINFNTEDWDTDSAYDNSTNYRFTVPAGEGGKYCFSMAVGVAVAAGADGGSDFCRAIFYVNGAAYTKGSGLVYLPVVASGYDNYIGTTNVINLSAADYVEAYVYHDMGTSRQLGAASSFFSGFKLAGV